MYFYLQPFHTKELIDRANAQLQALGEQPSADEQLTMRVRYGVAAFTGTVQTAYYLALWIFNTLASLATLGISKTVDRWGVEAGTLAVASMMATGIAALSVVYLPTATLLSREIASYVDTSFEGMLTQLKENLDVEVAGVRSARKSQAASRGEVVRSDLYFDPQVGEMESQRATLIRECRDAYPQDTNAKCEAYRVSKAKIRKMARDHSAGLLATPFSLKEVDKFLVQKIAVEAETGIAELYNRCLEVWGSRVKTWGQKFDREAFCRYCLKEFQSARVNKKIQRLIRDVKEADNKERAYKESRDVLQRFLGEMSARVDSLELPWFHVRAWRQLFPSIDSWRVAQAIDRWIDPEMAFLTQNH